MSFGPQWFSGHKTNLEDLAPTHTVDTINSSEAVQILRERKPDLVLVFGTRVIKQPLIDVCADRIYNLHGGDPEEYRGLDTITAGRFIIAILLDLSQRFINWTPVCDTGRIILAGRATDDFQDSGLDELRGPSTPKCVYHPCHRSDRYGGAGTVPGRTQRQLGRLLLRHAGRSEGNLPDTFFER